jgi:hypothetical protein
MELDAPGEPSQQPAEHDEPRAQNPWALALALAIVALGAAALIPPAQKPPRRASASVSALLP